MPELVSLLRDAGLRVTGTRVAELEALQRARHHLPAESVADAVRPRLQNVSTQAIYDTLHTLKESGLLRRVDLGRGPARYELRVGDNHHHVVCRRCDAITDVDCAVGATPCLAAADDSDYEIDEAEVIYWGRCPECVAATSVSSGELERSRRVRHQLGDTALDPEQPRSRAMSHQKETAREEQSRRV
jgi:Fur family ferric uptake transcriptional regulator